MKDMLDTYREKSSGSGSFSDAVVKGAGTGTLGVQAERSMKGALDIEGLRTSQRENGRGASFGVRTTSIDVLERHRLPASPLLGGSAPPRMEKAGADGCTCGGKCGPCTTSSPRARPESPLASSARLPVGLGVEAGSVWTPFDPSSQIAYGGRQGAGSSIGPLPEGLMIPQFACQAFRLRCGYLQRYIRYLDARHADVVRHDGCAINRLRACRDGRYDLVGPCDSLQRLQDRIEEQVNEVNARRRGADQSSDLSFFDQEIAALDQAGHALTLTRCNMDAERLRQTGGRTATVPIMQECRQRELDYGWIRAFAAWENRDYVLRRTAAERELRALMEQWPECGTCEIPVYQGPPVGENMFCDPDRSLPRPPFPFPPFPGQ